MRGAAYRVDLKSLLQKLATREFTIHQQRAPIDRQLCSWILGPISIGPRCHCKHGNVPAALPMLQTRQRSCDSLPIDPMSSPITGPNHEPQQY